MYSADEWKAREIDILHLLAEGLSDNEIGTRLYLAHETVRWYNKQIFRKLGVNNRIQAASRAGELGLLKPSPPAAAPTPPSPPRLSPVQYVANGDVYIAYQTIGQGPVDLLFIHGFLSHLELCWENPEFTAFFTHLARFMRVILFDKRGVGLSDRIQGAPTMEMTIQDACCVLDAAASKQSFVMGISEGGAAATLLASIYPERVLGLILFGAIPKTVKTDNEPAWATSEAVFAQMIETLQKSWGTPWRVEQFAPSRSQDTFFRDWWARVLRAASSPSSVKAVLDILRQVDVRPLLPQIRIKTLVMHKTDDRVAPVAAGRYFATHIPNAAWLELPGADHVYFIESAAMLSAITQFCQEQPAAAPTDSWIAIILYIRLNKTTLDLTHFIKECRPRSFTLTPDTSAIIALFDSPSHAIQSARNLLSLPQPGPLQISLHVGECRATYPVTTTLEQARQAAELAPSGKIVVTRTLHDILAGSAFSFNEWVDQLDNPLAQNTPLYTLEL